MKRIYLIDGSEYKAKDLFIQLVKFSPMGKGFSFSELRSRNKILDSLEKSGEYVDIEDSDYSILKSMAETGPYGVASPDLEKTVDAVVNAKEPGK